MTTTLNSFAANFLAAVKASPMFGNLPFEQMSLFPEPVESWDEWADALLDEFEGLCEHPDVCDSYDLILLLKEHGWKVITKHPAVPCYGCDNKIGMLSFYKEGTLAQGCACGFVA